MLKFKLFRCFGLPATPLTPPTLGIGARISTSRPAVFAAQRALPLNPEDNPPESLTELSELIENLRIKSMDIKHQLEVLDIKEQKGEFIDYARKQRAMYARRRTNHSVNILQRILRERRLAAIPKDFHVLFVATACEMLDSETYKVIKDTAYAKLAASQATSNVDQQN